MRLARLADGGDARHASVLGGDMRAGAGAAFHAVDIDGVRPALDRHAHVVIDARRAELELDRDLPVGRLAHLLDLERKIVGAEPVWMARRRALIDAGRQRAHLGHLIGHLLAHQMAAETDLAALADEEFASIRQPQMMRVEAVARLDALIEPLHRVAPLVRDHAAFAGAGGRARHGRAARERDLRLVGERAEAHAGDVDRDVERHRPLGARADHRLGIAFLAIALDDEAGQRAGQKRQIVPVRDLLEQREAAHAVAAELRLDMDVVDDFRREDLTLAEDEALRLGRGLGAVPASCSVLPSQHQLLLGRLEIVVVPQLLAGDDLAEVSDAGLGKRPYRRSLRSSHVRSRSVISAHTASTPRLAGSPPT